VTQQNLAWSLRLLSGETYDDMDGGAEDLAGYRSLLRGAAPYLHGFPTEKAELDGVVAQTTEWIGAGTAAEAIAVCVPTKEMAGHAVAALSTAGVDATEITPDGAARGVGVRVGTLHRFKGMEFQRMVIAGVSDDRIPRPGIDRWRSKEPSRYLQELRRDRSLLFVAATRARDDLAVYWHGNPSRFLPAPLS
jgi:superfamily I DNA/RNA helicase